ncbi:MAG: cytochrome c biogenesis protein CcsA [Xanthomonadales bacterium]|nr:cytochrome c biogenesis protein CcsA [Xanthomonadales bacterium]MCC6562147.1 cytochrome c biogenesis protein CcsA [Xanthomonadales bacterium]
MSLSLALLASVFYALGSLAALTPAARPERLRLVPGLGCVALAAHLLMLFAHGRGRSLDLHFFNALSVTAALCVLGLLLLMHWQRLQRLAAVVFPIAAVAVLLALLIDERPGARGIADWRIATHAGLAVLAFAILSIAGVVALQLGLQDHALRTHQFSRMFSGAPPLVQVEQLLFQLIGAGFLVLTLALVTGVLFVEDLMAQHLAHKTVLSVVAWAVFGTLLFGRWRQGWRGRRAVRLVLAGIALLVLAYFGSKFVLELVLQRRS